MNQFTNQNQFTPQELHSVANHLLFRKKMNNNSLLEFLGEDLRAICSFYLKVEGKELFSKKEILQYEKAFSTTINLKRVYNE